MCTTLGLCYLSVKWNGDLFLTMEAGGGTVWKMDVYGLRPDHHNCKTLQEGNKIVGIWRVEFSY